MPTKIAWTDETWNPTVGCSKVSEGCQNCYAEKMAIRLANILSPGTSQYKFGGVVDVFESDKKVGWSGKTVFVDSALEKPLHWKKPRKIFVCSMGDLFHESVPFEWIDQVMAVIALCPQHTFQVLTKRPKRMKKYISGRQQAKDIVRSIGNKFKNDMLPSPLLDLKFPNLHLGVTAENQEMADKRIPILLQIPAAKKFVSCEPLLGTINFKNISVKKFAAPALTEEQYFNNEHFKYATLNQVIIGCESGSNRRPSDIEWARSIVSQCQEANVAVFVKQLSIDGKVSKDRSQWPEDLRLQQFPESEE